MSILSFLCFISLFLQSCKTLTRDSLKELCSFKEFSFKEFSFKEFSFKEFSFKEFSFKEFNFKEFNFKEFSFKEFSFKEFSFKEFSFKEFSFKEFSSRVLQLDRQKVGNFKTIISEKYFIFNYSSTGERLTIGTKVLRNNRTISMPEC